MERIHRLLNYGSRILDVKRGKMHDRKVPDTRLSCYRPAGPGCQVESFDGTFPVFFEKKGLAVTSAPVIAVAIKDKPGSLAKLLVPLARKKINIEYIYAFSQSREDRAVLVFRLSDTDAAIKVLQQAGINILRRVDLLS